MTPISCCINKIVRTSCQDNNSTKFCIFFYLKLLFSSPGPPGQEPDCGQPDSLAPPWTLTGHWSSLIFQRGTADCQPGSGLGLSQPWFIAPTCPHRDNVCQQKIFPGKLAKKNGIKTFEVRLDDSDGCGEIVPDSPHRIRASEVHG